ncbi:MAG: hypothetical protein KY452_13855, partial [Actinobacteria bacterium]|nr:hypothetical protein [Actinomycetota bacterium]
MWWRIDRSSPHLPLEHRIPEAAGETTEAGDLLLGPPGTALVVAGGLVEQPVDWVLGSGHTSRTYLYATPGGELYQLPLAWYSQDGGHWAMAPGFDRPDHVGLLRPVRRECMFCHNAYPDVP